MSIAISAAESNPFSLPNGLTVQSVNRLETTCLYDEIFLGGIYTQHGVAVADGDCVFDVGANVGLFSVYLLSHWQKLRLYAFEPIPALFGVLQQNLAAHKGNASVCSSNVGLSDAEGEALFEFNPKMTVWTTARREDVVGAMQRDAKPAALLGATIADVGGAGAIHPLVTRALLTALELPGLRQLELICAGTWWAVVMARRKRRLQRLRCRMRTLSQVIQEEQVQNIDLLKVDVEGGELSVLQGIAESDWRRIRQVVLEVHDVNGRVETIRQLLKSNGFAVTVDSDRSAMARVGGIHMVYAIR